jgi:RNA polymerase sigma-70 factor (ECF subfamily)
VDLAESPSSDTKFRQVFDAHLSAVQRYCVRRLRPADANDAVAEVFLVAWRRIGQIPDGDEALPWLLGVSKNVIRNLERSGRRVSRLKAKVEQEPLPANPGPEAQVVRHVEYAEVAAALESLSAADREVIRLRAWEELTAPQMAVVLGCSVSAAEKRMTRASQRLTKAVARRKVSVRPRAIKEGGDA